MIKAQLFSLADHFACKLFEIFEIDRVMINVFDSSIIKTPN